MRKLITIQEAEVLLERYYEGFTSGKEEKLLGAFLSQKKLPERFEPDKAILGYFDSRRKKSKTQIIPLLRWVSGVAASLMIGITVIHFWVSDNSNSYAYIDGKKITNIEQVKEQALASVQSWNDSDGNPNLDTEQLINQQLQLFNKAR